MSIGTDIYQRLPLWAQHGAVSTYGAYWRWLRFGPGFDGYLNEYLKRDRFSVSEWRSWQKARLAELLGELVRRGTLCRWARRRETVWQRFEPDGA